MPEVKLDYDVGTRRLSIAGGNRVQHKVSKYEPIILEQVKLRPGMSTKYLEEMLMQQGVPRNTGRDTVKALVRAGRLHTAKGEERDTPLPRRWMLRAE